MKTDHIYAEGAGSGGGGTAGGRADNRSMSDRARQAVSNMVSAFGRRGRRGTRRNR